MPKNLFALFSDTKSRSGVGDTLIVLVSKVLAAAAGLGVQMTLAWMLGPSGRGAFAACLTFATLMSVVCLLGLDRAIQVQVLARRCNLGQAMTMSLAGVAVAAVLAVGVSPLLIHGGFFSNFFAKAPHPLFYFALLLVPLLGLNSEITLLLNIRRRFTTVGIGTVLMKGVNIAFLLILLGLLQWDVGGALTAVILSFVVATFYLWIYFRKYDDIRFRLPTLPQVRATASYGTRCYLRRVGFTISSEIGILLLGNFGTQDELGHYAVAAMLLAQVQLVPDSLAISLLPRLDVNSPRMPLLVGQSCRAMVAFCFTMLAFLALVSGTIVPVLFSPEFAASVPILLILSAGFFFRATLAPLSMYFVAVERPGIASIATFIEVLAATVLSILFYPQWQVHGVAFAVSIGAFLNFVIMTIAFHVLSRQSIVRTWFFQKDDLERLSEVARKTIFRGRK